MVQPKIISRCRYGITLVELLVTMALMLVVMGALVPLFAGMRNRWTIAIGDTEVTQNARILIEHLQRHLGQSKGILGVHSTPLESGAITFLDRRGRTMHYELNTQGQVLFGTQDNLSVLASSVDEMVFQCFAPDDLQHPCQNLHEARLVTLRLAMRPNQPSDHAHTWTTAVFLPSHPRHLSGLMGHWPLDRSQGGTTLDVSGWARHGKLIEDRQEAWDEGVHQRALAIPKNASQLVLPVTISGDFSLAFWICSPPKESIITLDSPGLELLDAHDPENKAGFTLTLKSGQMTFGVCYPEGQAVFLSSSRPVYDGGWHHVVITWESATGHMALQVDEEVTLGGGIPIGTPFTPQTIILGSPTIGNHQSAFEGHVDDLRFFNRVLSTEELIALVQPTTDLNTQIVPSPRI